MTAPGRKFLLYAVAAVLPIVLMACITAAGRIQDLMNPCIAWGVAGGSVTLVQGGHCSSTGAMSQTTAEALIGLSVFQGGMIVGAATGFVGVLTGTRNILHLGSGILILESIPLLFDGLFVFALLPAIYFLWAGGRVSNLVTPTGSKL